MTLLMPLSLFFLGLLVGSFLNVVILRHGIRSYVRGRSACTACGRMLGALELIPVVSYVIQKGRCRDCRSPLSLQYPFVELATGLVFVLLYSMRSPLISFFDVASFVLLLSIASVSIVMVVYDVRHLLLPDEFTYSFIALAGLFALVNAGAQESFPSLFHVLAGPLLFLPFYGLWKYSHGTWIGLGDAKLAWGIGWLLGLFEGCSAIAFSFWLGAFVSVLLLLVNRALASGGHASVNVFGRPLSMKSEVPFGPFMIVAAAFVLGTGITLDTLFSW